MNRRMSLRPLTRGSFLRIDNEYEAPKPAGRRPRRFWCKKQVRKGAANMKKCFLAVVIIIVCTFFCSCGLPKKGESGSVQESTIMENPRVVPRGDDRRNDITDSSDDVTSDTGSSKEADSDDKGIVDGQDETNKTDSTADALNNATNMSDNSRSEKTDSENGNAEEMESGSDDHSGQTYYDPFELPED